MHYWINEGKSEINEMMEKLKKQQRENEWKMNGIELPILSPVSALIHRNLRVDTKNREYPKLKKVQVLLPIEEESDDDSELKFGRQFNLLDILLPCKI